MIKNVDYRLNNEIYNYNAGIETKVHTVNFCDGGLPYEEVVSRLSLYSLECKGRATWQN